MEWSKESPPRLRWVMWKCIFQKSPGCRSRSKVGGPRPCDYWNSGFHVNFPGFLWDNLVINCLMISMAIWNKNWEYEWEFPGNLAWTWHCFFDFLDMNTGSPNVFSKCRDAHLRFGNDPLFRCIFCDYQSAERSCWQVGTIFDLWNVSKDRYLSFTWSCLQVSSNILNGAACTILGMVKLLKRNSLEAQNYGCTKPIIPWVWGMNIHNFKVNRRAPAGFCWW